MLSARLSRLCRALAAPGLGGVAGAVVAAAGDAAGAAPHRAFRRCACCLGLNAARGDPGARRRSGCILLRMALAALHHPGARPPAAQPAARSWPAAGRWCSRSMTAGAAARHWDERRAALDRPDRPGRARRPATSCCSAPRRRRATPRRRPLSLLRPADARAARRGAAAAALARRPPRRAGAARTRSIPAAQPTSSGSATASTTATPTRFRRGLAASSGPCAMTHAKAATICRALLAPGDRRRQGSDRRWCGAPIPPCRRDA